MNMRFYFLIRLVGNAVRRNKDKKRKERTKKKRKAHCTQIEKRSTEHFIVCIVSQGAN